MSRRQLARPGLSYFDANSGRLVTESAELLDVKAEIRKRWPSLDCYFDTEEQVFVVTQKVNEDGTDVEKFVLSRPYCGDKILEDIEKANPESPYFVDPEVAVDKHNEKVEAERDAELADKTGDFGERFIHALKKDGFYNHENIERVGRPHLRKKAINAGIRP
jgi:hypothetical protein